MLEPLDPLEFLKIWQGVRWNVLAKGALLPSRKALRACQRPSSSVPTQKDSLFDTLARSCRI